MKKGLKIGLISIGSLIALLFVSGWVIVQFYEEEVKAYVIKEINQNLKTEIQVAPENINLKLEKLIYAALEFENVSAMDAIKNPRSKLFEAKKIALHLNLYSILTGDYTINTLEIQNTVITLWVDESGRDNYHFWKSSGDTASKSFELEKVILKNVWISYLNDLQQQDYVFDVKNGTLSGTFSAQNYTLDATGNVQVEQLITNEVNYLEEQLIQVNGRLQVDGHRYDIEHCDLKISNMDFQVDGQVLNESDHNELELTVKGSELDIQSFISLLPEKSRTSLEAYSSTGSFYFDTHIKGELSKSKSPGIDIRFGVENGEVQLEDSPVTLSAIEMVGKYTNGNEQQPSSNELQVEKFQAKLEMGLIKGDFSIKNFVHPQVHINVDAAIKLEEFHQLIPIDTIESMRGVLTMNAAINGSIQDPKKFTAEDFKKLKSSGTIEVLDAHIKTETYHLPFSDVNADLVFNNNDIIIKKLAGNIASSDFELKGVFRNALAYLVLEEENLMVDASLETNQIHLNELLSDEKKSDAQADYSLRFSKRIDFKLDSKIDELTFKNFKGTNIEGRVYLRDQKMYTDQLSLQTMGGEVKFKGAIDDNGVDKLLASGEASLKDIQIDQLFYQLENFGQETMQDKHLKGRADIEVTFVTVWSYDLIADLNKAYAKSTITVYEGELIDFEPLMELSDYIAVEELKHIRFSTLKNQIEVKNQTVYIPQMEVKSSALNIEGSGTHNFSNEIDYKIKVSMNELLSKKAKKAKKENQTFGQVEDDGESINLYFSMTGTVDDPIIKYDKKSAIKKIKKDIKAEKQNLKKILNEEFGWFKKDSLPKEKEEEQKGHQIIWDGSDVEKDKKKKKEEKLFDEDDEDF